MKQDLPEDLPGRLVRAGQGAPRAVPPPPAALVGAVREHLLRGRRLRRAAIAALAACFAGAVVLGAVGLRNGERPPAAVAASSGMAVLTPLGGRAVALAPGMAVAEGSRVTTHPGGSARLELEGGSELSLSPSAELEVERLSQHRRFRLAAGRADVHVQRLQPGQRFVIGTEDVEVEVRGTRFEVESTQVDAACDVATATRVRVFEGTVTVRHGADTVTLEGPAHWPACERAEAPAPEAALPEAALPEPAEHPVAAPPAKKAVRQRGAPLAELNARYREALTYRRRGDLKGALERFEDFYRRYPDSQLAEAARVEALRLLAKTDAQAARAAAEQYLSRYPQGFARDEARALLAE